MPTKTPVITDQRPVTASEFAPFLRRCEEAIAEIHEQFSAIVAEVMTVHNSPEAQVVKGRPLPDELFRYARDSAVDVGAGGLLLLFLGIARDGHNLAHEYLEDRGFQFELKRHD